MGMYDRVVGLRRMNHAETNVNARRMYFANIANPFPLDDLTQRYGRLKTMSNMVPKTRPRRKRTLLRRWRKRVTTATDPLTVRFTIEPRVPPIEKRDRSRAGVRERELLRLGFGSIDWARWLAMRSSGGRSMSSISGIEWRPCSMSTEVSGS